MNKTYFFISDVHLGLEDKEKEKAKERKLVEFLKFSQSNCDELFIAGDLFDYWFEYRRVYQKGFFRTLTALEDLVESGCKVHFFIGNHDFFHLDFFEKELGLLVYPNPEEFFLNGKKFIIGHGDGLVKNDFGYNVLKSILRNKFIQWIYSLIHPDLGVWLASRTSKNSRKYNSKKNNPNFDGLLDSAKNFIDSGFDYVVFGHLHRRQLFQFDTGYYINLGSWIDKPCYGKFINKFEIIEL